MDVKGLTISHVKSHLQMYRSMRGDLGRQDRSTCNQLQRSKQSFNEYDPHGDDDQVNSMGFNSSSKPIRESDSHHLIYSSLPSKRARIETRSSSLQCSSERIVSSSNETVRNPYCFDDYNLVALGLGDEKQQQQQQLKGIKEPHSSPFSLPLRRLDNLNPFKYAVQESDFFKVNKLGDRHLEPKQSCKHEKMAVVSQADDVEAGGCELSLSLPLHHRPTSNRSNGSSTSEISEAISSSYTIAAYKDCSSLSSAKHSLNLDLSIALCGN
ncbi:Homeodomain-like [Trema orientale]|uniref:Homeodomain-like n=1 Tax=Trema orientale TaxID=63057 RepID=A0A2P5AQT7_TREOI|nr:Homeodomain-like [Trema orientale]